MRGAPSSSSLLLFAASLCACTQTLDFDAVTGKRSSPSSDSPEGFSCAMQSPEPTFCDDFDGDRPAKKWSSVIVSPSDGKGVVESRDDEALSEPRSLVASVPGSFGSDVDYAASALSRTFAAFEGIPIRVRVSFDMRIEAFDATANAHVIAFQFLFGSADDYNQLVLNLESRKRSVAAQFTETVGPAFAQRGGDYENTPELGEWAHVELELDAKNPLGKANGAKNRLTLLVDDVKLFDDDLSFDLRGGTPRMELGIPWVDSKLAQESWRIRYDNVLVYVEPRS
jgi:hypothetical protein